MGRSTSKDVISHAYIYTYLCACALFKAKGGRIGYRMGTPKKQTNVQKIKKTFGKGLGMQSVIYGLDKNPKITAADPKAKFIAAANKKKKKV